MDNKQNLGQSAASFTKARKASLMGAIFLMATSAIGPGFITQTATFTVTMGAAFAFGILASIVIDFIVQLNIWRIVTLTQKKASDIANAAIPGSGYLLAVFIIFGGLVFNVGNIAGAGLGLNALIGLEVKTGGALSAAIAIGIFLSRHAQLAVDRFIIALGFLMIGLTLYVTFKSNPPVGTALMQTVWPELRPDQDWKDFFAAVTTIVGGTVGGYITYAGAHRLLDSGAAGPEHIKEVNRAALSGIAITGVMRYVLFLAILGVVSSGVLINLSKGAANPAVQAFEAAAGNIGLRLFGLVLWAAGISSVIGAAFTSVSFFSAFKHNMTRNRIAWSTVIFIAVSLIVFLALGAAPNALLVFAGGFNGLILPIGLTIFIYIGWRKQDLLGNYKYPAWLLISGAAVCVLTWYMAYRSVGPIFGFLGIQL